MAPALGPGAGVVRDDRDVPVAPGPDEHQARQHPDPGVVLHHPLGEQVPVTRVEDRDPGGRREHGLLAARDGERAVAVGDRAHGPGRGCGGRRAGETTSAAALRTAGRAARGRSEQRRGPDRLARAEVGRGEGLGPVRAHPDARPRLVRHGDGAQQGPALLLPEPAHDLELVTERVEDPGNGRQPCHRGVRARVDHRLRAHERQDGDDDAQDDPPFPTRREDAGHRPRRLDGAVEQLDLLGPDVVRHLRRILAPLRY